MKRSVSLWQLIGFIAVSLGGTFLHYLYDLTGGSMFAVPFSGINESTWEHMKLLFWPMFVFALIERSFFRDRDDFWCIKLYGTLTGLSLIPILFYTYNGVFGKSPDFINIVIFFISAAAAFLLETHLFETEHVRCRSSATALFLLWIIAAAFVIFTFVTPEIPLFLDPVTGEYGLAS